MRGTKAKRLRKEARKNTQPTFYRKIGTTMVCDGYRRVYQDSKKVKAIEEKK